MAMRAVLCFALMVGATTVWAAPTAEQKAEIEAVGELMKKAGGLFNDKKFVECGEVIRQVQEKIEALSATGDKVILRQLESPHKQLTKAHALLELEGIELSPLMPLDEPKPTVKPKPEPDPKPSPAPDAGGLSFTKHIAPLLVAKCGRCHVTDSKGMFSAANYAALMKGAGTDGKVIFPGDAQGSRIIEVIESGDMPRGGGKLTQAEFEALKKWINDGAKFDGTDETASIAKLGSPNATPTPAATPMVTEATGKETVSFSKEIASAFASNCGGCHGNNNPRAGLRLTNVANLMKGGDNGAILTPGEGAKSLLVMKLKGTASGMRMPAGGLPPLADTLIAKIEKWIDEGAKFDGPDANAPLAQVAALAKAAGATHEELSADRVKAAEQTWLTAMPGVKHDTVETANFLVKGTAGENTLKAIVERAEETVPKIANILGAPSDKPLVKGRFTVLAVTARYDFSEIGKVILNTTSVPPKSAGLWRYSGVDAVGVVLVPRSEGDYPVESVVAEQATGAYLSGIGKNVPRWFAEGVGRVVVTRLALGDPRVTEWDGAVPATFASLASPSGFMDPKFDPDAGAIASYSFARFLMGEPRKFSMLLDRLRSGAKFDEAFVASYGAPPAALAETWWRKGPPKFRTPRPTANKSAKSE